MGANFCGCENSNRSRTMPTLPRKGPDEFDIETNPPTSDLNQQLQDAKSQINFFREELMRVKEEKERAITIS